MNNQLEQQERRTCFGARVPFHIRVAVGCGLCAGSLTVMAIEYWLLDMGRVGDAPHWWTLQTAIVVIPGIAVAGLVTVFSYTILRAKEK